MEKHTPGLIFYDQAKMQASRPSLEQASSQCLRYQDRLQYDMARTQLDLERQRALLLQKEEAERRIQDLRLRYSLCRQLLGCTVYGDYAGDLLVAITKPDEEQIISRRLLNVRQYQTKIYVAYHPNGERMVLEVAWGELGKNEIYFADVQRGIPPKNFLRKLKGKGIVLLVSGRAEKKVAEALLAYSLYSAPIVEIPFAYGWGRNSTGRWHFAKKDELTLKEILKNV